MIKEMKMTEFAKPIYTNRPTVETAAIRGNLLYTISAAAGVAAGGLLLVAVVDLVLAVLPPGSSTGWMPRIQDNWLLVIYKLHAGFDGIYPDLLYRRNLPDMAVLALAAVMALGLYAALRGTGKTASLIALAQPFLGIVLFTATASVGRCAVMGSGLVFSGIMLRSRLFSKPTAALGLLSGGLLLAGDFGAGTAPSNVLAVLTGIGYLVLVAWLFLASRRLFQLGQVDRGGALVQAPPGGVTGRESESSLSPVVLLTGCSTGIGRDLAHRLAHAGYTVVATARKVETLEGLEVALKLPLDVTRPESIQKAVDCTLEQYGRIDVLVNNAGVAVFGAAEEIPDHDLQMMFDVNVFGMMRMVRAVAPHMRTQNTGRPANSRIVNISSIVGKLVTPGNGAYAASKFAVEALSDALRLEMEPFGIQVVLVEPGSTKTHFADAAQARARGILSNRTSPYQPLYRRFQQTTESMRLGEPGPEAVSRVIQQAIEAPRPKARYLAGIPFSGRLVISLRDLVWEPVVRQMFRLSPDAAQRDVRTVKAMDQAG